MQLPSHIYDDKTLQVIYLSALYMSYIADLRGDSKKADDSIETDDFACVEVRIDLKYNFLAWQVSIHVSQDSACTYLPCKFSAHIQLHTI